jgi:hypothetical protein
LALSGQYDGEYVAGCASDRCGYFGTWPSTPRQATVLTLKPVLYLVDMERMYTRRGLLTEQYPVRSKSIFDAIFVIITHLPLALQMLNIRLRRQYPLCQLLGGRMVSWILHEKSNSQSLTRTYFIQIHCHPFRRSGSRLETSRSPWIDFCGLIRGLLLVCRRPISRSSSPNVAAGSLRLVEPLLVILVRRHQLLLTLPLMALLSLILLDYNSQYSVVYRIPSPNITFLQPQFLCNKSPAMPTIFGMECWATLPYHASGCKCLCFGCFAIISLWKNQTFSHYVKVTTEGPLALRSRWWQ